MISYFVGKMTFSLIISRVIILIAGVVYPAYSSYKSIKEQNVKGYIKWLIYWIVYALFASIESVTDQFVAWIPFYYEIKILVLLWLVSPASRGSIRFYVQCLHPLLLRRENEIDALLSHFKDLLYVTVVKFFKYIFSILRSSLSVGHQLILDQIKQKYQLQEKADNSNAESERKTEPTNEFSSPKAVEQQRQQQQQQQQQHNTGDSLPVTQVVDKQDSPKEAVPTPVIPEPVVKTTTVPVVKTTSTTAEPTSSTSSASSGTRPSVLDSRSLSSDRSKSLVTDAAFYDRYTRLSYSTLSSSSYSSASRHSSSPSQASSLYDRYARPTASSSSSRYSSSTYSPKTTSSYSSRYSKK